MAKFDLDNVYCGVVGKYSGILGYQNIGGVNNIISNSYDEYETLIYMDGERIFDINHNNIVLNTLDAVIPVISSDGAIYEVDVNKLKRFIEVSERIM